MRICTHLLLALLVVSSQFCETCDAFSVSAFGRAHGNRNVLDLFDKHYHRKSRFKHGRLRRCLSLACGNNNDDDYDGGEDESMRTNANASTSTQHDNHDGLLSAIKHRVSSLLDSKKHMRHSRQHSDDDGAQTGLDKLGRALQNILHNGRDEESEYSHSAVTSPLDDGMESIVATFRESTEQGQLEDTATFAEIFAIFDEYGELLQSTWARFVGSIGHDTKVSPAALWYYLEHEDERKNPSWKRRVHRYQPTVIGENLSELNEILGLAQLTYLDTADEVQQGLQKAGYDLVYIDLVSEPGRPAHFIGVQTSLSESSRINDDELAVLMGIRGTKTVADTVTDLLCEATDYKGGKAHGYLLNSAKYLVDKHLPLMTDLMQQAGKSRIVLILTGHSLGAGIAAIASIEFNNHKDVYAYAYGFGTPPTLTLDLAQEAKAFITTVISDADIIPRLSTSSMANLILSVSRFNWKEYAARDINHALGVLHLRHPLLFNDQVVVAISTAAQKLLRIGAITNQTETEDSQLLEIELYPPGRCVHFYRDGKGLSSSVVPNEFFSEIDVSRSMITGAFKLCSFELQACRNLAV
ncbi:hypothetical protein MPSEU_000763200 [Mayamaea pseudoterrestris]|nr:hypothetical protein MPSEU_000763200 [Mayamaea pseudoterrestris]